jgi:hypothetical protein
MMDPMFDIPKGRKRISSGKVSLLLGMTALLYLLISNAYAAVMG